MHQKQPIKKVKNYLKKSLGDMALKLGQCLHRGVAKEAYTHLKGSVWSMSQTSINFAVESIYLTSTNEGN